MTGRFLVSDSWLLVCSDIVRREREPSAMYRIFSGQNSQFKSGYLSTFAAFSAKVHF
jgi:hypothetical protein